MFLCRSEQVLAAERPLGGQRGSENPSEGEMGCMEKEVLWRKGGQRAGSWEKKTWGY